MENQEEKNATLLLVDDECVVLGLMKNQLELEGYRVCAEHTGQSAIETVKHERVDAVVLDVCLKEEMDGFEVLERIKQLKPNLPVIVMSGNDDKANREKAIRLGALEYIVKPIRFGMLANILANELEDVGKGGEAV